ncbi:hypothetical protein Ddye_003159 [Dipteronia dyeriana]|uniref:Reverse transcriptase n=1 Tax=Dipteronia dyeriana TaxID=168575 RepID=A0AAE0CV17_9ROSI|nr:hypothetical protein Ddye_003159 [Dipteronia dyeriana]
MLLNLKQHHNPEVMFLMKTKANHSMMERFRGLSNLPWRCIGDFNEVLYNYEQEGGVKKPQSQLESFREAVDYCGLEDLGFSGPPFTWSNKRDIGHIQERFDRGIDGLSALFYQKYWGTVGDSITFACLRFLNNEEPLDSVNSTLITLIPKLQQVEGMADFRPISLCNVIYKIVAKAIFNRFRTVIGEVISDNQSAFIPGQLISDNAIIGFECLYALKKLKSKDGAMAIKLDMSKAFDRVECDFLFRMMTKLGFSEVDLWFCEANERPKASRQLVNFGKSVVRVSKTVNRAQGFQLANIVGVRLVGCHERCLGLPSFTSLTLCVPDLGGGGGGGMGGRKIHWGSWEKLRVSKKNGGLDFRDLDTFNRALLAKQGWRLVVNPHSLAARVLKSKYHPGTPFTSAVKGKGDSLVWNSLIWGRGILEGGTRWCIGHGLMVEIYNDRWIPRPTTFRISSPQVLGERATVSSIISPSGGWNVPLIHASFLKDDVDTILSMPTSSSLMDDSLFWHFNRSGVYSVRSGYKVGKSLVCRESSSSSNALEAWWKFLWGLKLPNKIIIFIWKACSNWLPAHLNLAKRGMSIDLGCPICRKKPESTRHALWGCSKLKQTGARSDENLVGWALNFVNELNEACSLHDTLLINPIQLKNPMVKWSRPNVGMYKVNTDAAIQSTQNRIGIGIVIRDNVGSVMGCSTQVLEACFSPQVAEATAILRGFSFAMDSGLLPAVFESDAQVLVDLINSGNVPLDETGTVIVDILRLINSHNFQVSFAPRSANVLAHSLAKLSFSSEDRFYLETFPPCLERLVMADCPV